MTNVWHAQWVHGFVTTVEFLSFAWRDIYTAAERVLMFAKEWCISWNLAIWTTFRKSTIVNFVEFLTLVWQTQWQMFLLVSGQHGASIQVSLNAAKKFVRISCIRKIAVTWISAGVFAYLLFFLFPDSGFYLLNGFEFDLFLFWSILSGVTLKTSNSVIRWQTMCRRGVNGVDRPNTTRTVRGIRTFAVLFSVSRPFLSLHSCL